jgi:immune inhibitor A
VAALRLPFLSLVALASIAHAVPAPPSLSILTQPDGTGFLARQWGDEWAHGWETEAGYSIVRDPAGGWTYGALGADGELVATASVVGVDPPPAGLLPHLRPITPQPPQYRIHPARPLVPRGTWNLPVLLVGFPDRVSTTTPQEFEQRLFGTGTHSLRDYYAEVSYNQFIIASGPSGIGGWYQATRGHDYYGEDAPGTNHDRPERVAQLVTEAVAQAEASGFDFSAYDNDGDCVVDSVVVVYQGSVDAPNTIWPSFATIPSYRTQTPCGTGYLRIGPYTIQSERGSDDALNTVGVFAHELGHALGLPDLYDVDYSSAGVGNWSVMGTGCWMGVLHPGDRPVHLDPWSKAWLGWLQPDIVAPGRWPVDLSPVETTPLAYQLRDTDAAGEYFLVENREPMGFDVALPGAGLLIWHVAAGSNWDECYPGGPSCLQHHYGVAVVQADGQWQLERNLGRGDAGDPFPGVSDTRFFDATSVPAARLYRGTDSGVSVTEIGDPGTDMRATLIVAFPTVTPTRAPSSTPIAARTPTPTSTPTATRTHVATPIMPPTSCTGDCDGSGEVTITELLTLVRMAAGSGGSCAAGDANHDGQVTIDEVLEAVHHAVTGCAGARSLPRVAASASPPPAR